MFSTRTPTHHGVVVRPWLKSDCQCGCHRENIRESITQIPSEGWPPFPKAVEHGMCQPCADEAYLPWTTVLRSLT